MNRGLREEPFGFGNPPVVIVGESAVSQNSDSFFQLPVWFDFAALPPCQCCRIDAKVRCHPPLGQPVHEAVGLDRFSKRRLLDSGEWIMPEELDYLGE